MSKNSFPFSGPVTTRSGLAGVSTLELMIAIAIMAMAFIPLYDLLMGSRADTIRTEAVDVMAKLASGMVDEITSKPYNLFLAQGTSAGLGTEYDIPEAWYALSKVQYDDVIAQDRYIDVQVIAKGVLGFDPSGTGTPDRNYSKVTVKVTWKEKRGGEQDKEVVFSSVRGSSIPLR